MYLFYQMFVYRTTHLFYSSIKTTVPFTSERGYLPTQSQCCDILWLLNW